MPHLNHRTLIREGHAGLALPEYPEIFDPEQRWPIKETRDWIDSVFDANTHIPRTGSYEAGGQLVFPPTSSLAIMGIRRGAFRPAYIGGANVHVRNHQILSIPLNVSGDLESLLEFKADTYGEGHTAVTYSNEAIFYGSMRKQHEVRDALQSTVKSILDDLGYGTPQEFMTEAQPLDEYRESRGIEWPRKRHQLASFIGPALIDTDSPDIG